jgi:nucleolar protein 56
VFFSWTCAQRRVLSGRFNTLSNMQVNYLLFETASGYSLFTVKDIDNVGLSSDAVQQSISDMARFSKIASLLAFKPFTTAVDALEQINAVSESQATEMLATFLKSNLPKASSVKKAKFTLGVTEPKLGSSIQEATSAHPPDTS